jgi:hypothetical protein
VLEWRRISRRNLSPDAVNSSWNFAQFAGIAGSGEAVVINFFTGAQL